MSMKYQILLIIFGNIVLGMGCQNKHDNKMNRDSKSYFYIGDISLNEEESSLLKKVEEDMGFVLQGKKPKHAIFDKDKIPPLDGGTLYYKGDGYALTIWKKMARIGDVDGVFYGPEVEFTKFGSGYISHVRFYSNPELSKLLSE